MDLTELTEGEHTFLERKLTSFRSPWRRAFRKVWPVVDALLLCYVLNTGMQFYRFATSEPMDIRIKKYATGLALAEQLSQDETFMRINKLYLKGKMLLNDNFERNLNDFVYLDRREEETREEFKHNIERIYNPMKVLE